MATPAAVSARMGQNTATRSPAWEMLNQTTPPTMRPAAPAKKGVLRLEAHGTHGV